MKRSGRRPACHAASSRQTRTSPRGALSHETCDAPCNGAAGVPPAMLPVQDGNEQAPAGLCHTRRVTLPVTGRQASRLPCCQFKTKRTSPRGAMSHETCDAPCNGAAGVPPAMLPVQDGNEQAPAGLCHTRRATLPVTERQASRLPCCQFKTETNKPLRGFVTRDV